MATLSSAEIRDKFLSFFEEKGHKIVPSAPIVIKNDPTLMFTNAGMNQFKEFFLGFNQPPHSRIADTQKCLRVSGKHNDLEEVGVDTYHHTMFEMLGNWSFGDYFKKEAIAWSWELLTEVYGIEKDRLYVTVFEGNEADGLAFDQEAYEEWKKWIDEERILKGNKKDNFWEMGETGPCGPCSEIHIDCRSEEERKEIDGSNLVNADHPQVIEIWNNVFIEFNRSQDGNLHPLPAKHIDTGMGFERLVRVLQQKQSNYDTDIFSATIQRTEEITGRKYENSDDKSSIAFRVIADHIRAIAFTIADGQLPEATGAGYVIRRILRRAVRYYYTYLDYQQPLLHQLIPVIAAQFQEVFPELKQQEELVSRVIKEEETAFLKTLEKGIKRFEDYINITTEDSSYGVGTAILGSSTEDILRAVDQQNPQRIINGAFAFELYDTYGFPLDLTELMAQEKNWEIDQEGFREAMQQQKERSRAATTLETSDWEILSNENTKFVGYENYNIQTEVTRFRTVTAKNKTLYQIALAETPFYPEGGGQVGDTGVLIFGEEVINVLDTKKENDLVIHIVDRLPQNIHSKLDAKINVEKRIETAYNHSATHLVHSALRTILGEHIQQKGSLVSPEVLRFDIAHFSKITDEELIKVMDLVNEKIRENIPVVIKELPKEEAIGLGAMALFGEKYGDVVRTVIMDSQYSIELCGGTHVGRTGDIGAFVITSESAVAAGIRRIEALTGKKAMEYLIEKMQTVKQLNEQLKTNDTLRSIDKIIEDKNTLEKQLNAIQQQALSTLAKQLSTEAEPINNVHFIGKKIDVENMDAIKKVALDTKNLLTDGVVLLTSISGGKPLVALAVSDQISKGKNLHAGKIIKEEIAQMIKGGGGGSDTLATAGGSDISNLEEIISLIKSKIQSL